MNKKALRTAALLAALLMAAASFGCKKHDDKEANATIAPSYTDVPIVTENAEANITAGPTATPFVPIVTENPEANITAGPIATPFVPTQAPVYTNVPIVTANPSANITEGPTATPYNPPATPAPTNVPIVTANPTANITAGPTATPPATPAPTNVPIVTANPTANITAGPTATPPATPAPTNVPIVTANPTANITAGPTATPTPKPTAAPTATPKPSQGVPPAPTPDTPNGLSIVFSGEAIDISSLGVGDTFFWTVDLSNENSCLLTAILLIDYPEEYIEPIGDAFDPTWTGGLKYLIEQSWDDEEAASDHCELFLNAEYEGATGPNPYGYAGNMYSLLLIQDLEGGAAFGGIQASGHIARLKFRIKALPPASELSTDVGGRYLTMHVGVATCFGLWNGQQVVHGSIVTNPGKLYFGH